MSIPLEEDPTRMGMVLESYEEELLWALNMADFFISEEIEDLVERHNIVTLRRAALTVAVKINRLSAKYQVTEGYLPLDDLILEDQVKATLDALRKAGPNEHKIRLEARTSLMQTFNTAARQRYKAFGIKRWRYLAHAGACTDPKELPDGTIVQGGCMELHGQEFDIDDEVHWPPIHPNCVCTGVPILPGGEET